MRLRRRPAARGDGLRALVVDDSAVVRQILAAILSDDGIEVVTAADPIIAGRKIEKARPDVIVLDLEMPRMDGLTFLRQLSARDPIPVVVCSSYAPRGSDAALSALEQGALGIVAKPRVDVKRFLEESATRVVDAVRAAAQARGRRRSAAEARVPAPIPTARGISGVAESVLAIGASTGGPDALRLLVEALPPDAPGTAVVQHMPAGFTRAFAERLDRSARVGVKEAEPGDELRRGRVLIAPGDRHLRVVRSGRRYEVDVSGGPLVSRHRPSVDVLFHSVAESAGRDAVGVILTGMGEDGARGLMAMREAGARTFAQSEETCAVYGMPKAAVARGAVDEVCALARLPERILRPSRIPQLA